MLDVNPDAVCRLITLAHAFYARETIVVPNEPTGPADRLPASAESGPAGDATRIEFHSIIESLEPDQQQQVVALMWLGRGEYELNQWPLAVKYAAQVWNERTADYLLSQPMLADHLAEGLNLHGYDCD